MKPLNKIFIRVATENSRKLTLSNGIEIFFDDSYNENWHRIQIGQAVYVPDKHKNEIAEGDIIYFHHLATIDANKISIEGETLYMQPIDQIFAVKKGDEIICLANNVFVKQTLESEDNIKTKSGIWLKPHQEEIKQEGTVIALPKDCDGWVFLDEKGKFTKTVSVGDKVRFMKKSEYQINADFGKDKVYKMRLENILMVLD